MFTNSVGKVTDGSVIIFNKVPYIDIEYPIPYIPNQYTQKMVQNTCLDTIKYGLNFYDIIREIKLKDEISEKMSLIEENELRDILKGGVIYK